MINNEMKLGGYFCENCGQCGRISKCPKINEKWIKKAFIEKMRKKGEMKNLKLGGYFRENCGQCGKCQIMVKNENLSHLLKK